MKDYLQAINDLEKNLLPPHASLFWHDGSTEKKIKDLLAQLRQVMEYGNELDAEKKEKLEQLYATISRIYGDFQSSTPQKETNTDDINERIITISKWFKQRYAYVQAHPNLRRLFRKYGCEMQYKKRIDIRGRDYDLTGPAIIVCTHHLGDENKIIQAAFQGQIFWVGDPYWHLGPIEIRWNSVPLWRTFIRAVGALEIDRRNPAKKLRNLLRESTAIIESNGAVGVMVEGFTDRDKEKGYLFGMGHAGFVAIAQYAEDQTKRKIPIMPIAVQMENDAIVIKLGEKQVLPLGTFDRNAFAERMRDYLQRIERS